LNRAGATDYCTHSGYIHNKDNVTRRRAPTLVKHL
jgi:hypothetical protein